MKKIGIEGQYMAKLLYYPLDNIQDYKGLIQTKKRLGFIETYNKYYWEEGLSIIETAKRMMISKGHLERHILKYHLRTRNPYEACMNRYAKKKVERRYYEKKHLIKNIKSSNRMKEQWALVKKFKNEQLKQTANLQKS